ncbi:DUF86 domain-containing protein [bacterium]|nr:DUF86 domain-containing protein [bacterium]
MVEKDRLYLIHIKECLDKIDLYIQGENQKSFEDNSMLQDAVIRNLQILSESTQRLSNEAKQENPEVAWHKISGFRNIVVHAYLDLDIKRVWLIIQNDIPQLKATIQKMIDV